MATSRLIKLSDEHAALMRDLRVSTESTNMAGQALAQSLVPRVTEVINLVLTATQEKLKELMVKGNAAWEVIGKAHNLDLKHQNWELHPDGQHIILLGERYDAN